MKTKLIMIMLVIVLVVGTTITYSQIAQNSDSTINIDRRARLLIQSFGMGKPQLSAIECVDKYCSANIYLSNSTDNYDLGMIKVPLYHCELYNYSDAGSECLNEVRYSKEELKTLRNQQIKENIEKFAKTYYQRNNMNRSIELEPGEITLLDE